MGLGFRVSGGSAHPPASRATHLASFDPIFPHPQLLWTLPIGSIVVPFWDDLIGP